MAFKRFVKKFLRLCALQSAPWRGIIVSKSRKERRLMDQCEHCAYFTYDDATEEYICDAVGGFDEDDVARFSANRASSCPLFRFYDEYKLVQKQN